MKSHSIPNVRPHPQGAAFETGRSHSREPRSRGSGHALLNRHGLAQQLGLSVRSVDRLVEARRIPVIRAGRSIRFRLDRVLEALDRNATQEAI
ncbi:MAG: helix-turn-helix domain-containing protein [Verrucomicrobiales bacterium]